MKYLLIGTGRSLDVHLTAELLKAGEEVFCVLPSEVKGKLKIPSVAHSYYWTDISFSDYLKNSCKTINGRKHLYFACFRPYFFSPDR